MRPYIAIIIDSFQEAVQSRVLWVLLFVWTVILAAIAPFEILQGTSFDIHAKEITARQELIDALTRASEGKGTPAQQAIWNSLKPGFQQQIIQRNKNNKGGTLPMGELATGLNAVLELRELYKEDVWPSSKVNRGELGELVKIKPADLTTDQLKIRNRKLVELAFPKTIALGDSNSIWIGYAGIKLGQPIMVSQKAVQPFLEGWILRSVLQIGLGVIGIFIGIIVTSNMIPDMFQPGSLHLLLSKPISRSLLLLSKFVGGTAFIGLNVTYLLVGFYFLVGWRLKIWNEGLLICIPIFIFIFMIYYSVSMLAGLISKNAIIAIAVTGLFWVFCTTLGSTYWVMRGLVTVMPEITSVQSIHGVTFTSTTDGRVEVWDKATGTWQTAFGTTTSEEAVLGPYWSAGLKGFFFGKPVRFNFGSLQSDAIRLQMARIPELVDRQSNTSAEKNTTSKENGLSNGNASEARESPLAGTESIPIWSDRRVDWAPELPPRTRRVLAWKDSLAALTERGIYRLNVDALTNIPKSRSSFIDLIVPPSSEDSNYKSITPEEWMPQQPMDFTVDPFHDRIVVFTRGQLLWLEKKENDHFQIAQTLNLELTEGSLALVACNSTVCIVATSKDGTLVFENRTEPKQETASRRVIAELAEVRPGNSSYLRRTKPLGCLTKMVGCTRLHPTELKQRNSNCPFKVEYLPFRSTIKGNGGLHMMFEALAVTTRSREPSPNHIDLLGLLLKPFIIGS